MRTVVSSKGQLVLPAELRRVDNIEPGQHFSVERRDAGMYLLTRINPTPNAGFVDWLRSCPESDWFQSIPSESTASL